MLEKLTKNSNLRYIVQNNCATTSAVFVGFKNNIMSPVEKIKYCIQTELESKPEKIFRGSYKRMEFHEADVFIHCDGEDKAGTLIVNSPSPEIGIILYDKSIEDDEGLYLDTDSPVKFSGTQYVDVLHYDKKHTERLRFSHESPEDDNTELIKIFTISHPMEEKVPVTNLR